MKVIQVKEKAFDAQFKHTLEKLELISLREGEISVNLNSQVEVTSFIHGLHRAFHYEVVMLRDKLKGD